MPLNNNIERLQSAGILLPGASFTAADNEALESLTEEEVDAIISIRNRLGDGFIGRQFAAHGCDFIF